MPDTVLSSILGGASDAAAQIVGTSADALPRIVVHHQLGDFVLDPWAPGGSDLSAYGITGYDVTWGPVAPQASTLFSNVKLMTVALIAGAFLLGRSTK